MNIEILTRSVRRNFLLLALTNIFAALQDIHWPRLFVQLPSKLVNF